ncbi:hypothetical protein O7627_27005 [Solwaraspora sp. WMMD1047]|uniref:hypothetical protein n=1 Tax=Solwaraspora sp. WMMD1047 TaxID=3016102 RepID=UPI0024174EF2|nr:hypothetical protein [Solwaraspora sp. WMMD1047]MDG4832928.1 hypothetical protein [Solwaraspora sp. WMMD1047]
MALVWLGGAALLALIGGFLQGRESGFFFFVGLPFALAGVAAHVVAAVWPLRDDPDRRWPRPWSSTMVVRAVLGLLVGGLGMVSGFGYGTNHQVWFGERVTAEITDSRLVCGHNSPGCSTHYRLAGAGGEDLGWTRLCGAGGRIGAEVQVDVDPLGWVPPLSPACDEERRFAPLLTRWWLGGLGVLAVVIVFDLLWNAARRQSRPGDKGSK